MNPNESDYQGPTIEGTRDTIKLSCVDLAFSVDATDSTGPFHYAVDEIAKHIVTELPKLVSRAKFGLHLNRDLDFDKDWSVLISSDLSAEQSLAHFSTINYQGGGDLEETQFDALLDLVKNYQWDNETGVRRCVVLCSSSDSKPTQNGFDESEVGQKLSQEYGIKLIVISPRDTNLVKLAQHAGGDFIELSLYPDKKEIDTAIQKLTKSLTQVAPLQGKTINMTRNSFGQNGTIAL